MTLQPAPPLRAHSLDTRTPIDVSLPSMSFHAAFEALRAQLGLRFSTPEPSKGDVSVPDAICLSKPGGDFGQILVDVLSPLEPLDRQADRVERLCTPPALHPWLFGGEAHTYLVLDAARVPFFDGPDSAEGLECRSLYQADAADTLAEVAPYIVALRPDHDLTRHLFTRAGRLSDLWDAAPGIFLRSSAPLDTVRASLRKFTRLDDASGKATFLRFFDPAWSLAIQLGFTGGDARRFFADIESVICCDPDHGMALRSHYVPPATDPVLTPLALRDEMTQILALRTLDVARRKALDYCETNLADFDAIPPDAAQAFSHNAMRAVHRAGLRIEQAAHLAFAALWVIGAPDCEWLAGQHDIVGRRDLSQTAKARALFQRAYDLKTTDLKH